MADDSGKVYVHCERAVYKIHETLKSKIQELAKKKSWSSKQKEDFEKKLIELYRDAVEESVKKNVSVAGNDWSDTVAEKGETSDCAVQEEIEPLNRERLQGLNKSWGEFEDLIRQSTSRRKHYPAQMVQALRNTLQCHKDITETYEPAIKNDTCVPRNVALNREDVERNLQSLRDAVTDLSQFSKSYPELQGKTNRLLQAVQSHRTMQECETNAVLFGKESKMPHRKLRSESHMCTPGVHAVSDIVQSMDKSKTSRSNQGKSQIKQKSRTLRYNQA